MMKLILKTLMVILLGYISYKFIKKYGTQKNKGTRFLILIPVCVLCCMTFFTEIKALFSPVKNVEVLEVKGNGPYCLSVPHPYYKMSIKDTLKIPVMVKFDTSKTQVINDSEDKDYTAENIKSILVNPMLNTEVFDNCDDAVMVIDEQIIEDDIKVFEILALRKGDTGIKFISDAGTCFVIVSVEENLGE